MDSSIVVRPSDNGDDVCVVELGGEIDVFASPNVRASLLELTDQGRNFIVVDLQKVTYIDSTGLGALVAVLKRAQEKGGSIAIVCTHPQIRRIFDITGLVKVFGMFGDVESAKAELRGKFINL